MSANFRYTSCPAPLAYITYAAPYGSSGAAETRLEVAPENIWRKPFHNWLKKSETINHIFNEIDPYTSDTDGWVELIEQRVAGTPIADDPEFQAYLDTLRDDLTIHDAAHPYAGRVIFEVANVFLETAHSVFVTHVSQGAILNLEYITGGVNVGDVPTEHFKNVATLRWLDFFRNFPIANIDAHGNITEWRDHNGNIVAAPQITPAANTDEDN